MIIEYFSDWKWCCNYLKQYPDMIPTVRWGRYQTLHHVNHNVKEREMWTKKDCNHLVGGRDKTFYIGMMIFEKYLTLSRHGGLYLIKPILIH